MFEMVFDYLEKEFKDYRWEFTIQSDKNRDMIFTLRVGEVFYDFPVHIYKQGFGISPDFCRFMVTHMIVSLKQKMKEQQDNVQQ